MKYSLYAIVLFIAMPLMAQQGKPTPPPAKPAATKTADTPVITELQETKFELAVTKLDAMAQEANTAMEPWRQKRSQVINEILAANPGWMWHESAGQNDQARFVKIPPPPPPGKTTKEETPK